MSDFSSRNLSDCPQTHAGDPAVPAGHWKTRERLQEGDGTFVFYLGGRAVVATERPQTADTVQLSLPPASEYFDPRQGLFNFEAPASEGGDR